MHRYSAISTKSGQLHRLAREKSLNDYLSEDLREATFFFGSLDMH